jgi:hypothetical protein
MRKLVITRTSRWTGHQDARRLVRPQLQDDDLLRRPPGRRVRRDLLGRQTFEDFRGYWPNQHDDATRITDYLNRGKYVV